MTSRIQMDDADILRMNSVLRHRYRNIASGIKSAVRLLAHDLQDCAPQGALEYFPLIARECDVIDRMTTRVDLLFEPRPDSSTARIADICERLLARFQTQHPTCELTFNLGDVGTRLVSSAKHLSTTLFEIVTNSADADRNGTSHIDFSSDDNSLHFTISDSGNAAPLDDLSDIFLPFFTTRSRHIGIGLSIAQRLTTEMGGTITAETDSNGGLIVLITIPSVTTQ